MSSFVSHLRDLTDKYLGDDVDADMNDLLNMAELTKELLDILDELAKTASRAHFVHQHSCCVGAHELKKLLARHVE